MCKIVIRTYATGTKNSKSPLTLSCSKDSPTELLKVLIFSKIDFFHPSLLSPCPSQYLQQSIQKLRNSYKSHTQNPKLTSLGTIFPLRFLFLHFTKTLPPTLLTVLPIIEIVKKFQKFQKNPKISKNFQNFQNCKSLKI